MAQPPLSASPARRPRAPGEGAPDGWAAVRWSEQGVVLLDQRQLPEHETYLTLSDAESVARAIESMAVRGAPAIGCAAALGVALAARQAPAEDAQSLRAALEPVLARLGATRPTAVNLFWALGRMRAVLDAAGPGTDVDALRERLVVEAERLVADDRDRCRAIGAAGVELVPRRARILTHCNAGALATGGYGTALGVVRAAAAAGLEPSVWADETRPFFQGARLTAWELRRDGIAVTVIADSMAGDLMRRGEVDLVLVGADRIAANGDVANKIGTYGLAVLARHHGVPFYVAAPLSTVDPSTPDGAAIPIEERDRAEMARVGEHWIVPADVPVRHPAFDVTPAGLVDAIVTEKGVIRPDYTAPLRALLASEA